jgi:hypothetical protein
MQSFIFPLIQMPPNQIHLAGAEDSGNEKGLSNEAHKVISHQKQETQP